MRRFARLLIAILGLQTTCLAQDVAPPVVTTLLQGNVTDATSGAAVAGAFVEWRNGGWRQQTWTDALGAYAFAIPTNAQGELNVSIKANLYLGAEADVLVLSGKPSTQNFALTPKPTAQIGVLSGYVTNLSSGQAIGGVVVSVLNAGGTLTTMSQSDGTYNIPGVGFRDGLVLEVKPGPVLAPNGTTDDAEVDVESSRSTPCFTPIEQPFELNSPTLVQNFAVNPARLLGLPPDIPCPGPPPPIVPGADGPCLLCNLPGAPPANPTGQGFLLDDASVQWQQADASEIVFNSDINLWHAGHVNDILKLSGEGGLLVGADTGGVWQIPQKGGQAVPLSNTWDSVNISALAFGADGPTDIYAGTFAYPAGGRTISPLGNVAAASQGGVLLETDLTWSEPLRNWHPVEQIIIVPNPNQKTKFCTSIYRILVINEVQRIVLACDNGIWWSPIPPPGPPSARVYLWKEAIADAVLSLANPNPLLGVFSGLAKGPGWSAGGIGTPPTEGTIVASSNGGVAPQAIIFYGGWSNGDLVFHSANVPPAAVTLGFQIIGRTSVASCTLDPGLMFAIGADPDDHVDAIRGTWKSEDGGQNWTVVPSPPDPGNQGSYNNAIAVAPDCSSVAVAWRNFTFVSFDGGASWTHLGSIGSPSDATTTPHSDYHAVTFDPEDPTTIYIGNDGGVFSVSGVAQNADLSNSLIFDGHYNEYLFDLQFYHAAAIADPPQVSIVVAGALQDNGGLGAVNPACCPIVGSTPWQYLGGGDGYNLGFVNPPTLSNGIGILLVEDNTFPADGGPLRSVLTNIFGVPDQPQNAIPLLGGGALPNWPTWGTPFAAVKFPSFSIGSQKMYAITADQGCVYGFFANDDGSGMNLRGLGCVNFNENITALSSFDGNRVFVGTDHGNIYLMQGSGAAQGLLQLLFGVTQLAIAQPPNAQGNSEAITAILEALPGVAFSALQVGPTSGYVLEWQQQQQVWKFVGGGLPNGLPFMALESSPGAFLVPTIFAATGGRVYDSHDLGNSWRVASDGLPEVPQGLDLHFITGPGGTKYLYLATYGRSLWRAQLP